MQKRYYWMKLKEDFFTTPRIKKLRKVPGGDTFVMIYLKMAMLSLNSDAVLFFEHIENTFVEEIALKIDEDENSVFITVEFLEKTGLMVQTAEDRYKLVEIEGCIGSETDMAIRQRRSRERRRLEEQKQKEITAHAESHSAVCDNVTSPSQLCHTENTVCDNVTPLSQPCHTDIDIDKDIEKKKETYVSKEKESAFERQVIDEFVKLLLQNDPFSQVPVTEEQRIRWYMPIRRLRARGYAEADILNTMRFALTNEFWKAHVLTPARFGNKFSQLFLKYQAECRGNRERTGGFNNFTHRQYDMDKLERELLKGTST